MKTIKTLLIFAAAISALAASAQQKHDWAETSVIVIGDPQNELIQIQTREYFSATLRKGFQQVGMPKFIITDKKNRAVFAIGGFVNFRTAYDFNNVVGNIDFVTYSIPMLSTPSNAGRLLMDASTSRLYFKTLINTSSGKSIETYIETDFRGHGNALRLREAYISWNGWTAGQTVSTFTDLGSSFNTIDFEGPNGYTYGRNLMLQYKKEWANGLGVGIAAEFPVVSATTGEHAYVLPQRIPDIPAYVQYSWDKGQSHVRASAIMRNMYYQDKVKNVTENQMGWGVQFSGNWQLNPKTILYGQFVYGQGITPYVLDLAGNGLDMMPDQMVSGRLSSPHTSSWLAGVQYNITPQIPVTLGYSQVLLSDANGAANQYKLAQYAVGNIFYNFNRMLSIGVEYLYGTRYDQNNTFGSSNRVQAAVQFNF